MSIGYRIGSPVPEVLLPHNLTPLGNVSEAAGLIPKTAGPNGNLSWTWTIGGNTQPGTGQVTVTYDGVSASTSIQIG